MATIDWQTSNNELLLNDRLPPSEQLHWEKAYIYALSESKVKGAVFILTSGTSGEQKLVAIQKKALLASAASVNSHLKSTANDTWLNPLPLHHVGGLSIYARAHLAGARVLSLKDWDAKHYYEILKKEAVSLSSLVPTQAYDLLQLKHKAPDTLRAIVIGGSHFSLHLQKQATALSYPMLASFGASETSSQIATATEPGGPLKILSHAKLRIGADARLEVSSSALFSFYVKYDPKKGYFLDYPKLQDGYFTMEDMARIQNGYLEPLGRSSEYLKVLGEAVSLVRLEREFESAYEVDIAIVGIPDERRGYRLAAVCETKNLEEVRLAVKAWNQRSMGYERVFTIYYAEHLARTDLGKLSKTKVIEDVQKNKLASLQGLA